MTNIYIVEDDLSLKNLYLEIMSEFLPDIKFKIFNNGLDLLLALNSGSVLPDAIFTDIAMPKMCGYELIKTIRNSDRLKHLNIVVISGSFFDRSFKYPIQGILDKPFTLNDFIGLVSEFTPSKAECLK